MPGSTRWYAEFRGAGWQPTARWRRWPASRDMRGRWDTPCTLCPPAPVSPGTGSSTPGAKSAGARSSARRSASACCWRPRTWSSTGGGGSPSGGSDGACGARLDIAGRDTILGPSQHPTAMKTKPLGSDAEAKLLADVSVNRGWALIERFADLNRESGGADEFAAADYVISQLQRLRIPHDVHEPRLYLPLPRSASVELPGGITLKGKPPAFAASTEPAGLTAPIVHVPGAAIKDVADLFEDHRSGGADVRGKIVVSEGYAMPLVVERFERAGAAGQVFINPGKNVHWGICTSIWGAPTDKTIERKPRTPVLAIGRPDGDRLTTAIRDGLSQATIKTALEEGWYRCKLPVARIAGASDDFMLVHGHYDSWDVGIGDNAVGDATLLELARIFHAHRKRLRRSLLVAWWPGHSMGRYAGSTWFADRFAMGLRQRCVAALNIDSPGCWQATQYDEVMWMAEAGDLCRRAIRDATGVTPHRLRPIRAGDYSFNQLGLTSFFMLLSNIPKAERDQLGFYPVGGCGGNIAWHTEERTELG